eukprot:4041846-Pleurochrysis_carterae.AAC.1
MRAQEQKRAFEQNQGQSPARAAGLQGNVFKLGGVPEHTSAQSFSDVICSVDAACKIIHFVAAHDRVRGQLPDPRPRASSSSLTKTCCINKTLSKISARLQYAPFHPRG